MNQNGRPMLNEGMTAHIQCILNEGMTAHYTVYTTDKTTGETDRMIELMLRLTT